LRHHLERRLPTTGFGDHRLIQMTATPHQALERTAPGGHPGSTYRLRHQPSFRNRRARAPQSLSLRLFGVAPPTQ
jgi:hypothetical protein